MNTIDIELSELTEQEVGSLLTSMKREYYRHRIQQLHWVRIKPSFEISKVEISERRHQKDMQQ